MIREPFVLNSYFFLFLSQVTPIHDERQCTNIHTSSFVNPWTTSTHSFGLQSLSSRTQLMPHDRKQQDRPIVELSRGGNALRHSTVAMPRLTGEKTKCSKALITALCIIITLCFLTALVINIYVLTSLSAVTMTSTTTGITAN